jgi:uncharacterized membrane protein
VRTNRTRIIVYAGVLAAVYVVLTWALAPISYGQLQFRVSEILKPVALWHPLFALAFGVGNALANLQSPFGAWDFIVMPFVDAGAALLCWWLGQLDVGPPGGFWQQWRAPLAVNVQAVVISLGVAIFPLGIAAGLPFAPTFVSVLISELILLNVGYWVIWRRYGDQLFGKPYQREQG